MAEGQVWFVDGNKGDNQGEGTESSPWRTIDRGVRELKPGETLYLRGGIYHEKVSAKILGTVQEPVTIRSYPGELAIIDGGFPEFWNSPETAWEPVASGAPGEFRSTQGFPNVPYRKDRTNLLGNFGDSMVPLHGYRFLTDLRSDNHLFRKLEGVKTAQGNGLYCGPGVFWQPETHRIHVRLAHTEQPSLPEGDNYGGETDPRKLPLVIADGGAPAFELIGSQHVILQDLVFRGARQATLNIEGCSNITLDGVTCYGGSAALRVIETSGLRCVDSAFRGIAAPWLWRWSLKYRSIEAKIVAASRWNPPARGNRDFRFSNCEFTDCVDGVFIGNVDGCTIHHSLLDNVSDDGFFLTCRTAYDGTTPGGRIDISYNRISGVLTAFAFGVGHGRQRTINDKGLKQLGAGTTISDNVLDLRGPVLYQQPEEGAIQTFGRVAGDHGSPAWENILFVRNTVWMKGSPWRNYYAAGWAKAMGKGTQRGLFNNIFAHESGMPGQVMPPSGSNFRANGNWHWSLEAGENGGDGFFFKSSVPRLCMARRIGRVGMFMGTLTIQGKPWEPGKISP